MSEADWESLEEEVLGILSDYGLAAEFEDGGSDLTRRFVAALQRKFAESEGAHDDTDD